MPTKTGSKKKAPSAPVTVSVVDLIEPESIVAANRAIEQAEQAERDATLKAILATIGVKPIYETSVTWTQALLERRIRTLRAAEKRHRYAEARYHDMVGGIVGRHQPTMAEVVMERHNASIAYLVARAAETRARHFLDRMLDWRQFGHEW